MRASTLRDRIAVQMQARALNAFGEVDAPWATFLTLWANVRLAEAQEQNAPSGSTTATKYEVRIRYREDIATRHQIIWRGRTLNIASVSDPDGKLRELLIIGAEHAQAGEA